MCALIYVHNVTEKQYDRIRLYFSFSLDYCGHFDFLWIPYILMWGKCDKWLPFFSVQDLVVFPKMASKIATASIPDCTYPYNFKYNTVMILVSFLMFFSVCDRHTFRSVSNVSSTFIANTLLPKLLPLWVEHRVVFRLLNKFDKIHEKLWLVLISIVMCLAKSLAISSQKTDISLYKYESL